MEKRHRMKHSNTNSFKTQVEENSPRSAVSDDLNSNDEIEDENTVKDEDPLEELTSNEQDLASPFTIYNNISQSHSVRE